MKVVVVEKDGSLAIRQANKPRYNEYQALVKTSACGMCGTDVKLIHRTFKGMSTDGYPIVLGHEGVGTVVEVGSKVTTFKVGDRVMLPAYLTDLETNPGLYSGWGGLAEYTLVCDPAAPGAPDNAFAQTVLTDDIDDLSAVMIVTLREVLSSIRCFGIQPQDSVVVYGTGPVGLTFIKFLSLLGVKNIIVCGRREKRLAAAAACGATLCINTRKEDPAAKVREVCPNGADYVLDAAGAPEVLNEGLTLLKDRGAVLCYGVPEKTEVTIDFARAPYNWSVVYQQIPYKKEEADTHGQILEWIRAGKLDPHDFISDTFPLEEAPAAYQKLLDKQILKKGVILFD